MLNKPRVIEEDAHILIQEMGDSLLPLSGTSILVTGAGGFLCSYLIDIIAAYNDTMSGSPCRIIGIDNFKSGLPGRLSSLVDRPDFLFLHQDVSKPVELKGDKDWIIHGASIASPPFYRRFPLETIDANVSGVRNMLDLAKLSGTRSMLFMSTSEIYGDPDPAHIPTAENYRGFVSCTGPRACYDESKRLGETLCATYYRLFGTPIKTIRPFNVYGPGQRLDDGRIIPDLISAALENRPIILFSDGKATRSFCYVRDAVKAMLYILLSDANGEPFNVGNDTVEISMADLATLVSNLVKPALPVTYEISPDQQYVTDNPQRRCPDLNKLRNLAPAWKPEVSLAEGLERTLFSYQDKV